MFRVSSATLSSIAKLNGMRTYATAPNVKMWIDNKLVESKATEHIDLFNPVKYLLTKKFPNKTSSSNVNQFLKGN